MGAQRFAFRGQTSIVAAVVSGRATLCRAPCIAFVAALLTGVSAALAAQTAAVQATANAPSDLASIRSGGSAADGYCEYVEGVAASESAPLMSPEAFATGGVFNSALGAQPLELVNSSASQKRILAGLNFSLRDFKTGEALRQRARAECEQYRATSALEDFLAHNENAETASALHARIDSLEAALPRAEQILANVKKRTEGFSATLEELNGTQIRVNELHALLEQSQAQLDSLVTQTWKQNFSVPNLLRLNELLDGDVEAGEARIREASAWDLDIRAGYDHIFEGSEALPLLATATLSYRFGRLSQTKAEIHAAEGRRLWIQQDPIGVTVRSKQLVSRLRAIQTAERKRLKETDMLLADLESRAKALDGIDSQKVQTYLDYWWFDITKLRAESAYLQQHLMDLSEILGSPDGTPR